MQSTVILLSYGARTENVSSIITNRVIFYELTFSCYERSRSCWSGTIGEFFWCQAIDKAIAAYDFALAAFVLMPEHVHLLVYPRSQTAKALAGQSPRQWHPVASAVGSSKEILKRLTRLLADIKQPFSRRVKRILVKERSPLLSDLTVLERPGKEAFRFWQEGPGYDRNLSSKETILAAIDYFHLNPVRRGLAARAVDWKWSSSNT